MATEEPAPKRAKPDEEAGADAPAPLYEKEPEKYVSARDAIKLAFVGADGAGDARFVPEYVHQIFEGESIACPPAERPLNIEVLYAASTLDVYYRLAGDPPPELEGAAEAAMYKLAEALPPPAGSLAQLTEAAGAAFDPAELCGEPLPSTDPACAMYIGGLHEGPPSRRAFAERIQSIFRWAIETSEAIDMDDERWRLLTLFAVAPSGERTFVGAATLFRFQRWASAKPGEAAGPRLLVRICQVAVAPSARSQGHGARMLRAVYEYARAEGAQEVTVEDPNPSFRLLRDLTDVRACLAAGLMKPESASAPPTAAQLAAGRTALLITEEQLVRCYELQQYKLLLAAVAALPAADAAATAAAEEALTKPYRLGLKKRLNKKNKEELDALLSVQGQGAPPDAAAKAVGLAATAGAGGSAEADEAAAAAKERELLVAARKARLDELYHEAVAEYAELAKRIAPRTK